MHAYAFALVSTRELVDTENPLIRMRDFNLKLSSSSPNRFRKSKLHKLTNFAPKKETSPRHPRFLVREWAQQAVSTP
jgi:hypothetical protein